MAYTNRLGTLIKADKVQISLTHNDLQEMIENLASSFVSTKGIVKADLVYSAENDSVELHYGYVTPKAEEILQREGIDITPSENLNVVLPLLFNTETVSYTTTEYGAFFDIEMGFDTYMKLSLEIY